MGIACMSLRHPEPCFSAQCCAAAIANRSRNAGRRAESGSREESRNAPRPRRGRKLHQAATYQVEGLLARPLANALAIAEQPALYNIGLFAVRHGDVNQANR